MANVVTRDTLAEQLKARIEDEEGGTFSMAAARKEVSWLFDTISDALQAGDEVRIHGFGSFKTAERKARTAFNPRTMEPVKVPARRVVRFAASTTLSAAVKGSKGGRKAKR